jgi:DNA repair exonuclease SbcCD ATPase subunit
VPTLHVPDVTISLAAETCYLCGVPFAMPAEMKKKRLEDHGVFHCPNGHGQCYSGKTEAQQLREQLAAKDRELAASKSRAETERGWRITAEAEAAAVTRSLRATKAVVTRTKKKIVAGRCPCCSTKFKDLAIHMRTEHPNYDPEKAAAALEAKV